MFRLRRLPLLALVPLLLLGIAYADVTIEFHLGSSAKPPTSLSIRQDGHQPTAVTDVHYETRPWVRGTTLTTLTQNYYGVRVGYHPRPARDRAPNLGIELELLHDKAYYVRGRDPGGVVQHFELSDGVNYLLVNGAVRYPLDASPSFPQGRTQLLARAGLGPVVTAPASTIRGLPQGHDLHGTFGGYEFAGFGFQVAGQLRQFVLPWLALSTETRFTYSRPTQSIAEGSATTSLPTFHLNLGVTFAPGRR